MAFCWHDGGKWDNVSLPAVQYDEMIALDVKMLPHHEMYTLVFLNNDVSLDLQPSVMPFHFPSTINIMLDISSIISYLT